MTTKERILAAWNGVSQDHVPLTTWCFGLPVPLHLRWKKNGEDVKFWYSERMRHIHTLMKQWELQDDFNRVLAWQSQSLLHFSLCNFCLSGRVYQLCGLSPN